MSRKQRKVPFRVTGHGYAAGFVVRTAAAAVSKFRKKFDLRVDRKHNDPVWHGIHVAAVGEIVHFPRVR